MRVLHLIAPGPIAGAEKVVLGGCAALRAAGANVELSVMCDARRPEVSKAFLAAAEALAPKPLACRGRVDLRAVAAVARAARGADVVHVHGYKALCYALAARAGPIVVTHHGETAHDAKVRGYEWVALGAYRLVARVVAVSDAVRAHLVQVGVPERKIVTIANFVSISAVPPAPPRHGPLQLLCLGRLAPEKGLDVLIEALRSAPGVQVRIVGDGPERARLERAVSEGGLSGRVTFTGFQSDVAPHLAAAHALVMPSRREGLPMALIEAVASGRPVVASRVGGIPELVADGTNGRLVAPDDATALAFALQDLDSRYDSYAEAARAMAPRIRRDYSPEGWAARTLAEYGRVVGGTVAA